MRDERLGVSLALVVLLAGSKGSPGCAPSIPGSSRVLQPTGAPMRNLSQPRCAIPVPRCVSEWEAFTSIKLNQYVGSASVPRHARRITEPLCVLSDSSSTRWLGLACRTICKIFFLKIRKIKSRRLVNAISDVLASLVPLTPWLPCN